MCIPVLIETNIYIKNYKNKKPQCLKEPSTPDPSDRIPNDVTDDRSKFLLSVARIRGGPPNTGEAVCRG